MTDQEMIDLYRKGIKVHPSAKPRRRRFVCLHRLAWTLRGRGLV